MKSRTSLAALAVALAAPQLPGAAYAAVPDQVSLGRNAAGEPCSATRSWTDDTLTSLFDWSWSLSCRNVAASRSLGFVRVLAREDAAIAEVEKTLACGAASPVSLPGIGRAEARRCYDSKVGAETISVAFDRKGRRIIGSAVPSIAGPFEEALRIVSEAAKPAKDSDRATTSAIDISVLAAGPGAPQTAATGEFDPAVALQQGILLNHKGLHVQASRILNDALSRLPEDASAATRAELSLEAGLADSNIRFQGSAAEHFKQAEQLLAAGAGADAPFLERKRDTYRALDLLNRRRFRAALTALEQLVSAPTKADQPLEDLALVRALNQSAPGTNDVANAVAVPSTDLLLQLVIDAQANWARSVAMLALGDLDGSERTLAAAEAAFAPLRTERIDQTPVLWLNARIERQRGRLAARRGDFTTAVAAFDRAVEAMTRSAIGTAGTGNEPAIAELQFERAGILAEQGAAPDTVRAAYDNAVDALIASNAVSGTVPAGMDRYLDLLVADGARDESVERFFRAMQSVGEPAVARQLSQIQNVVTADPVVGAKVRDRADLERTITRLRYEISAVGQGGEGGDRVAALEAQRQAAETRLLAINTELAADRRFSAINDSPATVAEIRAALRPGEGYLKVSQLGRRAYGIFIDGQKSYIYPVEAPAAALAAVAGLLRGSIDGRLKTDRKLVPFEVEASHSLFKLVTGPAAESVAKANALVVDPAGPLEALPAGVLVVDRASVDRYKASRRSNPFDYSEVEFLAKKASLSTAVSPRSFLVVRSLPPSAATKPFIGFAEHSIPTTGPQFASATQIDIGNVCSAEFAALQELATRLQPIDAAEVRLAASALGFPDAPAVTGDQFTDSALRSRDDLDDYEVLHFATHGLEEGVWGCDKSPPALVTSFGDANSDGLLSFDEIAALRLDANLVVLSACETASGVRDEALARRSGQEESGSTLEGLVRAFLTANSRAVLATHWQVSAGTETIDLIRAFYSSAREANIGTALQAAQRELIARPEFSHPFYWGAYFVVGDSSKMMLSRAGAVATAAAR